MMSTGPEVTRKIVSQNCKMSKDKIMLIIEPTPYFVVEREFCVDETGTFRKFRLIVSRKNQREPDLVTLLHWGYYSLLSHPLKKL